MLKYEDNLWGKTELLHNQYKINCSYYKELIELIEKMEKAYNTFSETINDLLKNEFFVLEEKNSSFYPLFQSFQCHIKTQSQVFKDLCDLITKNIIEPYIKASDSNYKTEENLYKELLELEKVYKKSISVMEENKNNFFNKMVETEKLIVDEKYSKVNKLKNEKIIKNKEDISYNSIIEGTIEEDKYYKSFEETNRLIKELNTKERQLLNFYQETEEKRLINIKDNIYLLLIGMKTSYLAIISDIDNIVQKFINIKIDNDMNLFTEKNKSNLSPIKNIDFIPYTPFSSLNNSLANISENQRMNINYEVIKNLQKFFTGICQDLNMEEEKKRKDFRLLCLKLFDKDQSLFTKKDLEEIIKYIEINEYRKYFLNTLTNQRLNGKFKREEKLFKDLVHILLVILDLAEKEKNFENAKNCIILSQTFYKEVIKGEQTKKIYLMEYIKKHKWVSNISFWREFIDDEIIKDKSKFEEEIKIRNQKGMDIKKMYFSKIITYSNNMQMFGLSKKEAMEISNFYIKKYEMPEDLKAIIESNIEEIYKQKKEKNDKNIERKEENNIAEEEDIENNEKIEEKKDTPKGEIKEKKDEKNDEKKDEKKEEKNNEKKDKIKEEKKDENNDMKKNKIKEEKKDYINDEIKGEKNDEKNNELKNEIKDEINDENNNELKEKEKEEINDEKKNEIKEEIKEEKKDEKNDGKNNEIKEEIKEEEKDEKKDKIKEKIKEEKNDVKKVEINIMNENKEDDIKK